MSVKAILKKNKVSANGALKANEKEKSVRHEMFTALSRVMANQEFSRVALAKMMSDPTGKNIDEECGYPTTISFQQYKNMYEREGIATRVVSIFPNECWAVEPWVYETEKIDPQDQTEFEKTWNDLNIEFGLYGKLLRLDEVSGIGHYGILLIGVDDGKALKERVTGINEDGEATKERLPAERKLTYLMPFDEGQAPVIEYNKDPRSKRYGRPLMYELIFSDPSSLPDNIAQNGLSTKVHWSRVIHVADGCTTSDVFGTPRQRNVFNYLLNIRKTLGGSAEMFWHGGFPGISFEVPPDAAGNIDLDKEDLSKEIEKFFSGFKRYLALEGTTANQLNPNIADPDTHIDVQIMAICIALGVPQRVFMGTEEARLASVQDSDSWNRKVARRQNTHVTPNIIRAFVDRLMAIGILPKVEEYHVRWPDLYSIAETDRADITVKLVQALSDYVTSGAMKIFPPMQFFTMIMDLSSEEAEEVLKAVEAATKDPLLQKLQEDPLKKMQQQLQQQKLQMGDQKMRDNKQKRVDTRIKVRPTRDLRKRPTSNTELESHDDAGKE